MDSFQPLINLLVLLTTLSIAAERLTNLFKLRRETLKTRQVGDKERDREYAISFSTIWIGILLAILVKASFFEIMNHLDQPWETLGWVRLEDYRWIRSSATAGLASFVYTLGGCVITGIGLGFGSKFWHDLLGTLYEVRSIARNHKEQNLLPPTEDESA